MSYKSLESVIRGVASGTLIEEAKKISTMQIHTVLAKTKNAREGLAALKKAFRVNDTEAKKLLSRAMNEGFEYPEQDIKSKEEQIKEFFGSLSEETVVEASEDDNPNKRGDDAKGLETFDTINSELANLNEINPDYHRSPHTKMIKRYLKKKDDAAAQREREARLKKKGWVRNDRGGFSKINEDDMPASPDEMRMAMRQAEFLMYVGREVGEHLAANKEFPEWMQNKLSALHQSAKDVHASLGAYGGVEEEVELEEGKNHPAADELNAYAKKSGGIDKKDFQVAAGKLDNYKATGNPGAISDLVKMLKNLDTDPMEKILVTIKKHDKAMAKTIEKKMGISIRESVELEEARHDAPQSSKITSKDNPLIATYDDARHPGRPVISGYMNLQTWMGIHGISKRYQKQLAAAVMKAGAGKKVKVDVKVAKDYNDERKEEGLKPRMLWIELSKHMKEDLDEKTLTPAEKKKREEIAKAMERENPGMPMDQKMAIATAQAKKVAEATVDTGDIEKKKNISQGDKDKLSMVARMMNREKAKRHQELAKKARAEGDMEAARKHDDHARKFASEATVDTADIEKKKNISQGDKDKLSMVARMMNQEKAKRHQELAKKARAEGDMELARKHDDHARKFASESVADRIMSIRNRLKETKAAPKGHHFTKSGELKRGDADQYGPGGKMLRADPLDKQRKKIPPVTENDK